MFQRYRAGPSRRHADEAVYVHLERLEVDPAARLLSCRPNEGFDDVKAGGGNEDIFGRPEETREDGLPEKLVVPLAARVDLAEVLGIRRNFEGDECFRQLRDADGLDRRR